MTRPLTEALWTLTVLIVPLTAMGCTPIRSQIPMPAEAPSTVAIEGAAAETVAADGAFIPTTRVSIYDGLWHLNGKITYPRCRAEGLLLNVRMANATFEDRNPDTCPKGFDPDANTAAFVAKIPEYAECGIRAFTLCLQGAPPGYKGALNSAFEADGKLREGSMARVAKVIEACDRAGVVVILGCLDQEQDQILKDEAAVKTAVVEAATWIRRKGYTNVCLEIANEHADKGYGHAIIREPEGVRDLIRLARKVHPELLISASGMGGGRIDHSISVEADFLLLHFANVPVDTILERVASADKVSKAIVCNADPKKGEEGAKSLETAVNAICSWGFDNVEKNQTVPFQFEGSADDPAVYAKFKELSRPGT